MGAIVFVAAAIQSKSVERVELTMGYGNAGVLRIGSAGTFLGPAVAGAGKWEDMANG